jgi:hypothetical protein
LRRAADRGAVSQAPLMKSDRGPPMTLGDVVAAPSIRLLVWCRDCQHQVEPDSAEQARRYGADLPVPEWGKRLKCSQCGSKRIDFVLTGARRRGSGS